MWAESRRAIMLISTYARPERWCRKNSLKNRLTRLRTTAQPIFLLAVIPNRAVCRLFSFHTTTKPRTFALCGAEASPRNSDRFRKRAIFGNVVPEETSTIHRKLFYRDAYRKILTTFCSSPFNHQTAVFSCHPYKKTMGTFTRNIAWLIRSFHLDLPL